MRTAVDTNIISALWSAEALSRQAAETLDEAGCAGGLVICGAVYAELLAHPKANPEFVDGFLSTAGISIDFQLGEPIWKEPASRFAKYAARPRVSRGGGAKRLLVDFVVGAHALLHADRLLTLDEGRYIRDFPDLKTTNLKSNHA